MVVRIQSKVAMYYTYIYIHIAYSLRKDIYTLKSSSGFAVANLLKQSQPETSKCSKWSGERAAVIQGFRAVPPGV